MSTTEAPRYSDFAKRHYAAGEVAGERRAIRIALQARGLFLDEKQSQRIDDCDDLATLKGWSEAAITAEDSGDIFK